MSVAALPAVSPLEVRPGTGEQLARIAHFEALEHTQPEELRAVAFFLIGPVGGVTTAADLWERIKPDCLDLWHLVTDDWDDRDLDDMNETELDLPFDLGLQGCYSRTRDRLGEQIERMVWLARYRADAARRSAQHRDRAITDAMRRHPAGSKLPSGGDVA